MKQNIKQTKNIITISIICLILIIAVISLIAYINRPKIGHEYFTIEPDEWVDVDPVSKDGKDVEINVFKATRGQGQFDGAQLDLYTDKGLYSFFYHGFYNGEFFDTVYVTSDFYNLSDQEKQDSADKYAKIKITRSMNPENNIPEAFFIFKIENNIPEAYVFLDEDWKNTYPDTNIIVGNDFKTESSLMEIPFSFTSPTNGIYTNKVPGNLNFLTKNTIDGGIAVGHITKTRLSDLFNEKELNLTFVFMR